MTETLPEVLALLNKAFTEYRLLSDMISAAMYACAADVLIQIFHDKPHDPLNWKYDRPRTARIFLVALFLGAGSHFWYSHLDEFIPGHELRQAVIKVFLDQFFAGPMFLTFYLFAHGLLEGILLEVIYQDWRFTFPEIYKVDCIFWPTAQIINFTLVPDRFRVLYVNVASMIWNMFLTYVKHKTRREEELVPPVVPVTASPMFSYWPTWVTAMNTMTSRVTSSNSHPSLAAAMENREFFNED